MPYLIKIITHLQVQIYGKLTKPAGSEYAKCKTSWLKVILCAYWVCKLYIRNNKPKDGVLHVTSHGKFPKKYHSNQ